MAVDISHNSHMDPNSTKKAPFSSNLLQDFKESTKNLQKLNTLKNSLMKNITSTFQKTRKIKDSQTNSNFNEGIAEQVEETD